MLGIWSNNSDFSLSNLSNTYNSNNNIVYPGFTYDLSDYYMTLYSSNNSTEYEDDKVYISGYTYPE